MLKIIKDVDLKELENYGFEYDSNNNYVWKNQYNVKCLNVNTETREIISRGDKSGNIVFYDLIIAGLVVKVEN